jgi:hypothetical protein
MAPLATAFPVLYTFTHAPSYSSQLSSSPSVDASSPARNQENDPPSSLAKPKKRVNFSLSPIAMDASSPKTPKSAAPVYRKSILKSRPSLSNSSPATSSPAVSFGLESYPSFTAMLETMCAALEANDNHTKLDVYLNLNNALRGLKAYPDSGFLLSKVTALVTYVRRDIEFPSDSLEGCESRVMIQALKFFSFLVSLDQVVHLIDTQTVSWILNLSMSAIENPDIKKVCGSGFYNSIFSPNVCRTCFSATFPSWRRKDLPDFLIMNYLIEFLMSSCVYTVALEVLRANVIRIAARSLR